MLTDAIFTLALLAACLRREEEFADAQPHALAPLLDLLVFTALLWRRRRPVPVFALVCALAAAQWVIGIVVFADAALLVALYTVAAHCDRKWALTAAGVLEVGGALAVLHWAPPQRELAGFVFLSGLVTAALVLGVNIRTRRAYLASLQDRALRAEHERDQQVQIATASERTRIAREMHDIVAHNLSVMIALADGAAFAARRSATDAEAAARQVSATGRQALSEMQRLLGVLRGDGPTTTRAPQPGIRQVDDLVAQMRTAGLATSFTVSGQPFTLPPTAQLAVYRLVQEALTNVLKHAKSPTQAEVTVRYDDPIIELEITDDGRGRTEPADRAGGHGLTGMRERAAVFGGRVDAGPRPVGGWRVYARLDSGPATSSTSSATS
jgi:signal transduction histidine kinase